MGIRVTHVGFSNYLSTDRIVAIAKGSSSPVKRNVQAARDKGSLIDLTNGRRTKSVIFTDSQYVVISTLEPGTIEGRLSDGV